MPLAHEWAVTFGRLAANHLWQSTGFAAVAVVLALALRANSARVRYGLWLAASVKFLIPFSVLAALGGGLGRWLVSARPVARVPLAIAEIVQPFAPLQGAGAPAAVSVPGPAASGVLPVVLLAIWLGGLAAVLLCWWVRWRRVAAAVRLSTPLREGREVEALWGIQSSAYARAAAFNPEGVKDSSPRRKPWETEGACAAPAGAEDGATRAPVSRVQAGSFAPDGAGMRLARPMAYAMGYFLTPLRGWLRGLPAIRLVSSTARLEPGIFGIFRPVLWLPAGIGDRLGDAELEAILAHELCHARRRDNLAAVIHMAVEAVFWFHPLVWWLGARLTEERERACDEEVVRMGGEPQVYAESILKVCEFYLASPVACAAGVTGGELKKRIEGIMANRIFRKLNFAQKLLLAAAAIGAVGGPIAAGLVATPRSQSQVQAVAAVPQAAATAPPAGANPPKSEGPAMAVSQTGRAAQPVAASPALEAAGQTPQRNATNQPKFEVASVKPANLCGLGRSIDPRSVTLTGMPLKPVLMTAFGVRIDQIEGPSWLETDCFDISAKIPDGGSLDQLSAMLQALLTERFKLAAHKEDRPRSGYALVVDRGGPKFKEDYPQTNFMGRDARPGLTFYGAFGHGALKGVMTMAKLVANLSTQGYGPVQDLTGLTGNYDIDLRWTPNPDLGPRGADATVSAATPPGADIPAPEPDLFTALRESLGLKLERRQTQVQFVVIDHIERIPTEN